MCHLCEERSYDGFRHQGVAAPVSGSAEQPAKPGKAPEIGLPGARGNGSVPGTDKSPSR